MNCSHAPLPASGDLLPVGVPLLFIDASAPLVQAGLWQDGRWLAHRCTDAPALEEIFRSVSLLLAEAGMPFSALGGFIHSEGPGSILGIRLSAMALRVWTTEQSGSALPVLAVRSLPLVAAKLALLDAGAGGAPAEYLARAWQERPFGVFSEFRQGLWNWFESGSGDVFGESVEVIETNELARRLAAAPGRCRHLSHRKSWEAPPVQVAPADADVGTCPQVFLLPGLLRAVAAPGAFLTRPPEFQTTSGERHRGATPESAVAGGSSPVSPPADGHATAAPTPISSPPQP